MGELKVTQVRSAIGSKPKARGTLRALGLRRIGRSNVLPDRPEIQGMIRKVSHLVSVEPVEAPKKRAAAKPKAAKESKADEDSKAEDGTVTEEEADQS
jgi:large subunit ribosomal protein L30